MKTAKVSVLMSVYNSENYIKQSVESILNQTFTDFEFIIIDDCSTDGTHKYLQSVSDQRIKLFKNPQNKGITDCLVQGLALAQGEYLARMDSDDISLPERFPKQVAFLDQHPDCICCGCSYIEIPSGKKSELPVSDEEIKVGLFSNSQFAHPTVMLRRAALEENNLLYRSTWEHAEDYKLWTEMAPFGKFANLPEYLLNYRVHESQLSSANKQKQRDNALLIAREYAKTMSDDNRFSELFSAGVIKDPSTLKKYEEVERIVQKKLADYGTKNTGKIFAARKKQALKRGILDSSRSILTSLQLLISSGVFLGLKFYISIMMKRNVSKV